MKQIPLKQNKRVVGARSEGICLNMQYLYPRKKTHRNSSLYLTVTSEKPIGAFRKDFHSFPSFTPCPIGTK